MATPTNPRVVAIEEHYWDNEVAATFGPTDAMRRAPSIVERLYDYGELRIKEMDEAGISVQVLSHDAPSTPAAHRRRSLPSNAIPIGLDGTQNSDKGIDSSQERIQSILP